MELLSPKIIEDKILSNYIEYQCLFVEFQSKFLSSLHSRYQSIENGNLVLYFAKQTHQDILRQKDYDLNYDISYEKFWENHRKISPKRRSLVKVVEDTLLAKETARRKILELIKQKVLNKKNRNIRWSPSEDYKQSYNLFVNEEINDVCKLINYISEKLNLPVSTKEATKELKEKFSFYWFHYLRTQLEYLKLWNKLFKDSELILIFLHVVHLFASKAKEKNMTHKDIYNDPSLLKEFIETSISAISISEVTKIPRATCVRKLESLVKFKLISQDRITKRYYIISSSIADNLISKKITEKVVKLFSEFFFICLRTINAKT
jgi:hypothetical protein|tara:strand:+ start:56 stop:1015 length:960 start_codon:yes stop_codon:yes gene_type:complete